MEDKIIKRFKEFIETYPENMRTKVNTPNVIGLMEWSWKEAQIETLKWWISAFEQGAYTEKEALELMKDQLMFLDTNNTSNKENKNG